jgi:hypothetical protein
MARLALVLATFFAMTCNAWAWGDEGHRIVCEIAMRLAVSSTRAEIRRLIKTDSEFDFFSDSCTWPDHPRKRAAEHFINLARDSSGLASNDLCPRAQECVLSAIKVEVALLSSNGVDDEAKLEALKYLGHWVGDVQTPWTGPMSPSPLLNVQRQNTASSKVQLASYLHLRR